MLLDTGCACREAAKAALRGYDGNMQVGGGVNADNAAEWLDAGASHVIVTSFIFPDGQLSEDRLQQLVHLLVECHLPSAGFILEL